MKDFIHSVIEFSVSIGKYLLINKMQWVFEYIICYENKFMKIKVWAIA